MDLRLLGGAVLVLGISIGVIWWVGNRVRSVLGPVHRDKEPREPLVSVLSASPQIVKALQERGLATPAQLASMTETERQLLFATAAASLDADAEPGSVARTPAGRAFTRPEDVPTLYCPACGYRIERFVNTPPITGQCETCRAKVLVRRDGARLLLTLIPKAEAEARKPDVRP